MQTTASFSVLSPSFLFPVSFHRLFSLRVDADQLKNGSSVCPPTPPHRCYPLPLARLYLPTKSCRFFSHRFSGVDRFSFLFFSPDFQFPLFLFPLFRFVRGLVCPTIPVQRSTSSVPLFSAHPSRFFSLGPADPFLPLVPAPISHVFPVGWTSLWHFFPPACWSGSHA